MADKTTLPFQMNRAREAISLGFSHIEQQVTATENAVNGQPAFGLAFDLSKVLLESTCRKILTERQIEFRQSEKLSSLLGKVRNHLPFLPQESSNETKARQSLEQALSGLHSTVQGICELRNHYGFASHGYEADHAQMGQTQAILIAGAADVIIGFLYKMHMQNSTDSTGASQSEYDENEDFNNFIDNMHEPCIILEAEFRPSAILFHMEPETYRLQLAEFKTENEIPEAVCP